jgi:hypothetical protein
VSSFPVPGGEERNVIESQQDDPPASAQRQDIDIQATHLFLIPANDVDPIFD